MLAINVIVLVAVVLPLRQSVQSGSSRADASAQALREAMADLKEAEATRDGQAQASADLDALLCGRAAGGHFDGAPHDARKAVAAGAFARRDVSGRRGDA